MAAFFGQNSKNMASSEEGYSLIELLVVIVMIGIMSAVIFANQRSTPKILSLDRSTQKLIQDISHARGMAMGGHQESCTSGSVDGYGIFFDKADSSRYFIYANCDGDKQYTVSDEIIGGYISLENSISISDLKLGSAGTSVDTVSVFFEPPNSMVYANGQKRATSSVVLSASGEPQSKSLEITASGIVNVIK